MQNCKVNFGWLLSQSVTRNTVPAPQDVTLAFVLLILLLSAQQSFFLQHTCMWCVDFKSLSCHSLRHSVSSTALGYATWGTIKAPLLCDARQQPKVLEGSWLAIFHSAQDEVLLQMLATIVSKNNSLEDQPKLSAKHFSVLLFKLNSHLICFMCTHLRSWTSCTSYIASSPKEVSEPTLTDS